MSFRTLVLNIDRDDDIGFKSHVDSPVIGYEACLDTAVRLALADPEDSDVNAIFKALSTYKELKETGEEVFIAVLGGNHFRFIDGDRKIAMMLEDIVKEFKVDNCILITDGGEDEYVLPIIQNIIPISSIQRVVVSQMPNLEGTFYILKKIINDPKFSKIVLVLPGLTLLLYAICYGIGRPEIATMIIAAAIGGYLLYKGFSLDDVLRKEVTTLNTTLYRGRFSFVTYIGAIIFIIVGLMEGMSTLSTWWDGTGIIPMIMIFFWGSILWFTLSLILSSIGNLIDGFIYDLQSVSKPVVYAYFSSAAGIIVYGGISYILSGSGIKNFPVSPEIGFTYIIQGAIIGLICGLVGMVLQHMVSRWARIIPEEENNFSKLID